MIKLGHDIFITLLVALCLVTVEARYYSPKSKLRGEIAEVLDILLRGNGNPEEVLPVLSNSPKPILRIGNPASTHRDKPKPALLVGGYPKDVIPIGNPEVANLLRDNSRALRGGIPDMPRDNPKPFLLTAIPEISATPNGNLKPNPHGGSIKLLAMLREPTKPLLSNRALLRISKHSDSDNNLVPTSGINKYTIKDNDLKETFNRMIDTVAKVNDERIQSLKKFFELENYLPQVSRTTQQKNPLIAIIMNTPNYKSNYDNLNINHLTEDSQYVIVKKKHKEPTMIDSVKEILKGTYFNDGQVDDKESISQESDEKSITKNFYLRGWNGCKKSAAKYCRTACVKAFKYMCNDYQCSKKFKKDGKKQCKKKCNAEFIDDVAESTSDE